MKKLVLALIGLGIVNFANAQDQYDALRYSQTYQQGTARSISMGGAFGALGGDISVITSNPAGLGLFTKGEFNFTPEISSIKDETMLNRQNEIDDKLSMRFAQVGVVTSSYRNKTGMEFNGLNFAFNYNRMNNFVESMAAGNEYADNYDGTSMLDAFCAYAGEVPQEDLRGFTGMAYDAGKLIDYQASGIGYTNPHKLSYLTDDDLKDFGEKCGYGTSQEKYKNMKGGISSYDFGIATSFGQKLYIGASLGFQTINYRGTSSYLEKDFEDVVLYKNFTLTEHYDVVGTGVDFRFGAIFRPTNYLRLGAAIHTPTFYDIRDRYYSELDVEWDGGNTFHESTTESESNYDLRTPFKAVVSGAFIIPGYGCVSAEYEYVDYSKIRMESDEFDSNEGYREINHNIRNEFEASHNLRLGLEGTIKNFSIRAGYAMYANPIKSLDNFIDRQIFSAGLGIRTNKVYFDFTGAYNYQNQDQYLYRYIDVETGNLGDKLYGFKQKNLSFVFTVGFRF